MAKEVWPVQAAEHCYYLAVKAVRRDADVAANKLLLIAKLAGNPNRFVPAKRGASEPIALDDPKLGVRTTYQGQNVLRLGTNLSMVCGEPASAQTDD